MPAQTPIQAVVDFMESNRSLFVENDFDVRMDDCGAIDVKELAVDAANSVAKGHLEMYECGSGYIEVLHLASGRYLMRQYFDEYSAAKMRKLMTGFMKTLIAADPALPPPLPPIPVQFYDWAKRNYRARNLPVSPWLHNPGCQSPSDNMLEDPPEWTCTTFSHYVTGASVTLTVRKDGVALIEKRGQHRGPVEIREESRVQSEADFAVVYKRAYDLAVASGPTSHIPMKPPFRDRILASLARILTKKLF